MCAEEKINGRFQRNNTVLGLLVICMFIISLGQGYCVLKLYKDHETSGQNEDYPEGYQEQSGAIDSKGGREQGSEGWNPPSDFQALCFQIETIFEGSFYKFDADSYENLHGLQQQIQRLLDQYQYGIQSDQIDGEMPHLLELAGDFDLIDENWRYVVMIDAPGIAKSDLAIAVQGQILSIEAINTEGHSPERGKDKNYLVQRRNKRFAKKQIRLPKPVNAPTLRSELVNGVLQLTIVKQQKG